MRGADRLAAAVQAWVRRHPRLSRARDLGSDLAREAGEDRVGGLAAEVAFFVILSVFPGLVAMAAALAFLGSVLGAEVAQAAQTRVVDFLQTVLTDESSETVDAVRRLFVDRQTGLLTLGAGAAVWATARGFAAVIRALDVAYDVEETRGWARRQGLAVLLSLGSILAAAIMLAMLVVGPLLGAGTAVAGAVGLGEQFATAWDWLRLPVVILVLVAWSTTVLHLAPNHASPWRHDLAGAAFTTAWWLAGSVGFRYALALASGGNQVFGALGGALVLLAWIYVLALGLLLGGELNAVLSARRPGRTS